MDFDACYVWKRKYHTFFHGKYDVNTKYPYVKKFVDIQCQSVEGNYCKNCRIVIRSCILMLVKIIVVNQNNLSFRGKQCISREANYLKIYFYSSWLQEALFLRSQLSHWNNSGTLLIYEAKMLEKHYWSVIAAKFVICHLLLLLQHALQEKINSSM